MSGNVSTLIEKIEDDPQFDWRVTAWRRGDRENKLTEKVSGGMVIAEHVAAKLKEALDTAATSAHRAFDVYLNGEEIDTVFYGRAVVVDAYEVRRSLINHDGYNNGIEVVDRLTGERAS